MKNYFEEVDIIKGLAILTVVLEHAFAVKFVDLTNTQWCLTTVAVIKSFNMQLFFMISGFLFANSKSYDYKKAYISKIDRLLVPMLFLTIIQTPLFYLFSGAVNREEYNSLLKFVLSIFVYGESYWFIYTLFVIFCVAILLRKFFNQKNILLLILFLVCIKELNLVQTNLFQLMHVAYDSVYFLIGYLLFIHYEKMKKIIKNVGLILASLSLYIFLFVYTKEIPISRNWCLPILMDLVFVGGGLLIIDSSWNKKILNYFGRSSLQFYMYNGLALVPSRLLWAKIIGVHNSLLLVTLVFITCLLLLYVFIEITRRIPVVNYLCGFGRKKSLHQ